MHRWLAAMAGHAAWQTSCREVSMTARKTKILLDSGDADETQRINGSLFGQTTNPSLIAKNPELKKPVTSEHGLSVREQMAEYRKIVEVISPLVGGAGVSIEVFADTITTAEEMLDQAREMFTWIPNAFIKYPCTRAGLRARPSNRSAPTSGST
jgi:transaldolase